MRYDSELFIGVTSWNSSLFLEHCLKSAIETTRGFDSRIVVVDNASSDDSVNIARDIGVEVVSRACRQAEALNILVNQSSAKYTLLIHSDVVFISNAWFKVCKSRIKGNVVLVSPEDIGCGPLTRPFGRGKPESSFLFFDTAKFRELKKLRKRKGLLGFPTRAIDFFGDHVTHRLPEMLNARGYDWIAMNVLYSEPAARPYFCPKAQPDVWSDELGLLRYGLGNFYSIDGEITHYHNWYDRIHNFVDDRESSARRGTGFPLEFIRDYSARFLDDYINGRLALPSPVPSSREPKAL